jgi:hypothetical protein
MKRVAIASLWFIAAFCMHELAWSLVGSPRLLGVALGAAAAAFVLVDPLHLLATKTMVASKPISTFGSVQPIGH